MMKSKTYRYKTNNQAIAGAILIIAALCAVVSWLGNSSVSSAENFPNLRGQEAVEHLQKQGVYDSLQAAFKDARRNELADSQIKLTANDVQTGDTFFGFSVDVSGNTAVVGCPNCKVSGNVEQGAVYVFVKSASGWAFQQKLTANDGAAEDHFGGAVSIEGNTLAVGATDADAGSGANRGAVYVFVRSVTTWLPQQKLTANDGANNDKFGIDVSLSGETLAIGSSIANLVDPGAIYIFVRSGVSWTQQQRLAPSDGASNDLFGRRVGLDGDTVISGSSRHNSFNGAAYIFVRNGTVWTQQQKIVGSDLQTNSNFGGNVAVSGDTAIVGAIGGVNVLGAGYVFVRNGNSWTQQQKLAADNLDNAFGVDVAVSGDTILIGAFTEDIGANPNQGAAYQFVRTGSNWSQQRRLTATDGAGEDNFGFAVAIDGQTSIVGAVKDDINANTDQGSAYIFDCGRTEQRQITAADGAAFDQFGGAVAVSGDTVVVGAKLEEDPNGVTQGAAYVFVRGGAGWIQQQKLKAAPLINGAEFGHSVAISGNTIVVGAWKETILNPPNPPTDTQGAAYVFTRNGTVWTQQARLLANDGAFNDQFGNAVAIDGETIIVGAYFDDVGANANQGSAYIFVRNGANWTQQARISSTDGAANDNFGNAVSVSGSTVAVGAFQKNTFQGAAYIFTRNGAIWSQQQKLTAMDGVTGDEFGFVVSVSGNTVAVGAQRDDTDQFQDHGSVYIFTRNGTIWTQQTKIFQDTTLVFAQFGYALALDGENLIVGQGGGLNIAWVYTRNGTTWSVADEYAGAAQSSFGGAVGISGAIVSIGALARTLGGNSQQGEARIYYGDCSTAPVGTASGAIFRRRCKAPTQATLGTVSDAQEPAGSLTVTPQIVPNGITLTNLTNTNGTITANVGAECNATISAKTIVLRVSDAAFGVSTFNVQINVIEKQNTTDFDGDRRTDLSIFRPSNGQWWFQKSSDNAVNAFTFGTSTDKPAPADYDGDGKTDAAFWRASTGEWFVLRSSNFTFYSVPFGLPSDKPARGDFDGDGRADLTVYRPSNGTWYISRSSDGSVTFQQFGISTDAPVPSDYDDDGKDDLAVFRPSTGTWWIQRSTAGLFVVAFGSSSDKPVPGDYTGDGRADTAVFRPSNGVWYVLRSEDLSFFAAPFGVSTDTPAPGDYDGDGKFDFAVFRPSETNWYVQKSGGGTLIQAFGLTNDTPVPAAFVP